MKKQLLEICDTEAEYARRFCDYAQRGEYPFETAAFSSVERLKEFCEKEKVDILLIAEDCYKETLEETAKGALLLLVEDERRQEEGKYIYKYRPCRDILKEILHCCAKQEIAGEEYTGRMGEETDSSIGKSIKIIGLYTPVHRCLQTTLAITLGEILAREHKALYLNFESFSGLDKRLNREFMTDMSDLIYYVSNAREALCYKLKEMTETIRNLDYIPPVFSCMDLARVTPMQWRGMFSELEKHTEYEYLILDLSEGMQGLFEILRMCHKIFTLVREDSAARAKLCQYEKLLERAEYEDILQKTRRCRLPLIRNLPSDLGQLTHGELTDYVRKLVREEIYGE